MFAGVSVDSYSLQGLWVSVIPICSDESFLSNKLMHFFVFIFIFRDMMLSLPFLISLVSFKIFLDGQDGRK